MLCRSVKTQMKTSDIRDYICSADQFVLMEYVCIGQKQSPRTCKSACTTAFIDGAKRHLGPNAQLGFHQYKLELQSPFPQYDLKGEQEKEIKFYRQQGISEDFLAQVFLAPSSGIWFPSIEDLVRSGVVDEVRNSRMGDRDVNGVGACRAAPAICARLRRAQPSA